MANTTHNRNDILNAVFTIPWGLFVSNKYIKAADIDSILGRANSGEK